MKYNKSNGEDTPERELTPEATENLVGFFRLLFEIDRRMKGQDRKLGQSPEEALPEAEAKLVEPGPLPEPPRMQKEAEFLGVNIPSDVCDENKLFRSEAAKNLSCSITVRLDPKTLYRVRVLAYKKGVGPTTLIRMWVRERVGCEH